MIIKKADFDNVKNPSHYYIGPSTTLFELEKYVSNADEFKGALKFNIRKYVVRAGRKRGESEIKDLKKAKFYLDSLIDFLSEESNGDVQDEE